MTGHTPRHTLASHLLKNDQITEDQIRIILGHSNIATTKIYLREKHGGWSISQYYEEISRDKCNELIY